MTDWPQAYFTSEADDLEFAPARLITLQSYYVDKIYENVLSNATDLVELKLKEAARQLMDSGTLRVQPFVEIDGVNILVCLDYSEVDEIFVLEALEKIAKVYPKGNGRYYFGVDRTYKAIQIPWITPN